MRIRCRCPDLLVVRKPALPAQIDVVAHLVATVPVKTRLGQWTAGPVLFSVPHDEQYQRFVPFHLNSLTN